MVKNIIKYFLLLGLICFSFFYSDKVMNLINENDPLMIEIDSLKDGYRIEPVNAVTTENTIIPGVKGREVDLDKSYSKMREGGIFRESELVYRDLLPSSSLVNNKDKYIIKGSSNDNVVAVLVIIDDDDDILAIENYDNLSLFVTSKYLTSSNMVKFKNNEIYSYGNKGVYTKEALISDNSIINRFSSNKGVFCLSEKENADTLKTCNEEDMYVVIPSIKGGYMEVKNNLSSGSIILLDNTSQMELVIKYINSKGYRIIGLGKLLEE